MGILGQVDERAMPGILSALYIQSPGNRKSYGECDFGLRIGDWKLGIERGVGMEKQMNHQEYP